MIRLDEADQLLNDLADVLDVPASKYEEAKGHYDAVGAWLNLPDSKIAEYSPMVFSQGSFALGTAIRAIRSEDEYDVDAVCVINPPEGEDLSQSAVKHLVGDRLKENARYSKMLAPYSGGTRCWTLQVARVMTIRAQIEGPGISATEVRDGARVPTGAGLHFAVDLPFSVDGIWWQIVNTGTDATLARQLRGGFDEGTPTGNRDETAKYRGVHSVQCFAILSGVCVARSDVFVLEIY